MFFVAMLVVSNLLIWIPQQLSSAYHKLRKCLRTYAIVWGRLQMATAGKFLWCLLGVALIRALTLPCTDFASCAIAGTNSSKQCFPGAVAQSAHHWEAAAREEHQSQAKLGTTSPKIPWIPVGFIGLPKILENSPLYPAWSWLRAISNWTTSNVRTLLT